MLTIQPNFSSLNCKQPTFKSSSESCEENTEECLNNDFIIEDEMKAARKELDLWQGTKRNIEQIAKNTESNPSLKKGTDALTGLTAIAVGWGGLRWGSVKTLDVLSKAGTTDLGKKVKGFGAFIKTQGKNLKTWVSKFPISKAISNKYTTIKDSFIETAIGKKCKSIVNWFKSLNPKRVFVETMGVAGGGTAALETIGVNAVDGTTNKVETDENGNYSVNGRLVDFEAEDGYTNVA